MEIFVWKLKNGYFCGMGTIIGILSILFLIIYPPYMLIKWSIYGNGFLFIDFNRLSRRLDAISSFSPTGRWLKFNYYFLFLWTLGELALIMYLIVKFQ